VNEVAQATSFAIYSIAFSIYLARASGRFDLKSEATQPRNGS